MKGRSEEEEGKEGVGMKGGGGGMKGRRGEG